MVEFIRVSPTDLDSFEYYKANNQSFSEYVNRLLGFQPWSAAAARGTAFHSAVERLHTGDLSAHDQIPMKPHLRVRLPRAQVTEVPAKRFMSGVDRLPVLMSGRLDAIYGLVGVDYKTTSRPIDPTEYQELWQMRSYLWLVPYLRKMQVEVFRFYDSEIVEHQTCEVYPYEGLVLDLAEEVREFVAFLRELERDGYLQFDIEGRRVPPFPVARQG